MLLLEHVVHELACGSVVEEEASLRRVVDVKLSQLIEKRNDVRSGLVRIAALEHSNDRLVGDQIRTAEHRLQLPEVGRFVAHQIVQADATIEVAQPTAVEEQAVVAFEDAQNFQIFTAQVRLAMVDHGELQVLQML